VPRATVLIRRADGGVTSEALAVPPRPRRVAQPFEASVRQADETLRAAVRRTLVSDVPVGLFLSGGIDSSLIAAYAAEAAPGTLQAFTATFAGAATDELPHALEVGRVLGVPVTPVSVEPSSFSDPEQLLRMFGEPFADVAALPTSMLAMRARESILVALTGDGGDEVFGGYESHLVAFWYRALSALPPLAPAVLARGAAAVARRFAPGATSRSVQRSAHRALSMLAAGGAPRAAVALRSTLGPNARQQLYAPTFLRELDGRDPWDGVRVTSAEDLFDPDLDAFLPELFLRKSDVACMSVGFEGRAPMLDRAVVELGRSLPLHHLVDGRRGKRVLRALMARKFGGRLATRRKMGFAPPVAEWLRGPLRPLLVESVLAPDARVRRYVDARRLAQLEREHAERVADHKKVLWSLLLLELWLRVR
jgi:asparagine synthase (glutamine-hydrolysing)